MPNRLKPSSPQIRRQEQKIRENFQSSHQHIKAEYQFGQRREHMKIFHRPHFGNAGTHIIYCCQNTAE